MTYFSEHPLMQIGVNYTRGMLCDYMGIKYCKDEIERGIFKPSRYSSVFVFSTKENNWGYLNGKYTDNTYLFSSNNYYPDSKLTQHKIIHNELILFIRKNEESGFFYFGRCNFTEMYKVDGYKYKLYGLELIDTKFSNIKSFEVPQII